MRGVIAAGWLLGLIGLARPAFAQDQPPPDAADAVKIAAAAFEYRDFQRVVDTLENWIDPPRISDPKLMIEALRLIGVSYHVLGDVKSARRAFGQLLLLDPLHKLDPFVVPPKVIETFEGVRKEMKATLDKILAERGQRVEPDEGPRKLVPVEVPSRLITILPAGIPQFALDELGLGVVLGSAQVLGMTMNVVGHFSGEALPPMDPGINDWATVQYVGLAIAIAAYGASVLLANVGLDAHSRSLIEGAKKPSGSVVSVEF